MGNGMDNKDDTGARAQAAGQDSLFATRYSLFVTHSVEETWAAAAEVARLLAPGTVVALHGELGAGKTTFVQGLAHALGVTRPVTSPTFTVCTE